MDEFTPTTPIQTPQPKHTNEFWSFAAEIVKTVVIVVALAYVVRTYGIQPFVVEGSSMYPQFHNRDYLLVDKLTYRLKDVHRGDVVVFRFPKDPAFNYVKRVIGLPGDHIKIDNSKITITNKEHPNGLVLSEPYIEPGNETVAANNKTTAEYDVPEGSYFVMGDNRVGSSDSREWGELPKEDLIGRVLVLAYPFDRFGLAPHADYN